MTIGQQPETLSPLERVRKAIHQHGEIVDFLGLDSGSICNMAITTSDAFYDAICSELHSMARSYAEGDFAGGVMKLDGVCVMSMPDQEDDLQVVVSGSIVERQASSFPCPVQPSASLPPPPDATAAGR